MIAKETTAIIRTKFKNRQSSKASIIKQNKWHTVSYERTCDNKFIYYHDYKTEQNMLEKKSWIICLKDFKILNLNWLFFVGCIEIFWEQIGVSLKRHRFEDKREKKNDKHSLKDWRLPDIFQTVLLV